MDLSIRPWVFALTERQPVVVSPPAEEFPEAFIEWGGASDFGPDDFRTKALDPMGLEVNDPKHPDIVFTEEGHTWTDFAVMNPEDPTSQIIVRRYDEVAFAMPPRRETIGQYTRTLIDQARFSFDANFTDENRAYLKNSLDEKFEPIIMDPLHTVIAVNWVTTSYLLLTIEVSPTESLQIDLEVEADPELNLVAKTFGGPSDAPIFTLDGDPIEIPEDGRELLEILGSVIGKRGEGKVPVEPATQTKTMEGDFEIQSYYYFTRRPTAPLGTDPDGYTQGPKIHPTMKATWGEWPPTHSWGGFTNPDQFAGKDWHTATAEIISCTPPEPPPPDVVVPGDPPLPPWTVKEDITVTDDFGGSCHYKTIYEREISPPDEPYDIPFTTRLVMINTGRLKQLGVKPHILVNIYASADPWPWEPPEDEPDPPPFGRIRAALYSGNKEAVEATIDAIANAEFDEEREDITPDEVWEGWFSSANLIVMDQDDFSTGLDEERRLMKAVELRGIEIRWR